MATIRPSHSVDSDQTYPRMSNSMEYPTKGYSTFNQKRHSIRHSTSILEDEVDIVSIEHVNYLFLTSMCSKIVVAFFHDLVLYIFCFHQGFKFIVNV
jgi:hypothetical protein